MNFLKDIVKSINDMCKKMTSSHILMLVGVIALAYVLCKQNNRMGQQVSGYENKEVTQPVPGTSDIFEDNTDSNMGAPVSGYTGPAVNGLGDCKKEIPEVNPKELLPKGGGMFDNLAPVGADLNNVQLLKAGHHMGINTVGGTLRNANLQVRSEPANPVAKVSPWMNTTIEPDNMRIPLELGSTSA